jgi:2-(1,2-epoxy-1,2-dihydrophenyl)acetyl-CoA isomerase
MTTNYETILLDLADGVATITLNRPDRFNALDLQMSKDLLDATIRLGQDASVRCVVLTGAGKAFFAGGDLSGFGAAGDGRGALLKEMTTYFHAAIANLGSIDAPVIAKVNGVAAGAGFSTVLACDLAVAAASAKFTMAYTNAGLTPDGSSTWFLPRTVGLRRAQELTLLNPTLSAQQALEWGLITQVAEDGELNAAVDAMAKKIAQGPTRTLGAAKRLLRESSDRGLESQMDVEGRMIAWAALTPDGREGVAAFTEKRRAEFTGR